MNDKPIRLRELVPGDKPNSTLLIFVDDHEGLWAHTWRYHTDSETAEKIQQFCKNRAAQNQPIYKEIVERDFGVLLCH
jgi:hypothetical protein